MSVEHSQYVDICYSQSVKFSKLYIFSIHLLVRIIYNLCNDFSKNIN